MPKTQLTIRVEDQIAEKLKERAESLGMSTNSWVNHVIEYAIATKTAQYTVTWKKTFSL